MPLKMAPLGEEVEIRRLAADEKVKRHLENLGLAVGQKVTVLSAQGGAEEKIQSLVFHFRNVSRQSRAGAGGLLRRDGAFDKGLESAFGKEPRGGAGNFALRRRAQPYPGYRKIRTAAARKKSKEEEAKLPERELTSPVLFGMGVVFTAVELTSALPYFGFLAAMASHAPHAAVVILLTALYSFVYVLPLILIYFFYRALRGTKAIAGLERAVGKISAYILPVALVVLGIILAASGVLRAL